MSEENDRRIDDVTPDTDVTGAEKVPVSDNGTAKFVTLQQIVDFAAESFSQMTDEETLDLANDGVYMKSGGTFVPVSASKLAEAVVATLYAPNESSSALEDDYVALRRNGVAVKVKLSKIAELLGGGGSSTSAFDIHELQQYFETGIGKVDEFAVSVDFGTSGYEMRRIRFQDLLASIVSLVGDFVSASSSQVGQNDYIIVAKETVDGEGVTHVSLVRTKLSQSGIGQGDVKGPTSNTDGKVPVWDGANAKTLKDGMGVVTPTDNQSGITSQSSASELPSAASVYKFGQEVREGLGDVTGPSSSTDDDIARFDGTTGKLLKGGLSATSSIRAAASADNNHVPTEKAVAEELAKKVEENASNPPTPATVPYVDASGKLNKGWEVATSIPTATRPSGNVKLASDGAVFDHVAEKIEDALEGVGDVKAPLVHSEGKIPTWKDSGSTKELTSGLDVKKSISTTPVDSAVPTEKAVAEAIELKATVDTSEKGSHIPTVSYPSSGGAVILDGLEVESKTGEDMDSATIPTYRKVGEVVKDNRMVRIVDSESDLSTPDPTCPNAHIALVAYQPNQIYFKSSLTSNTWYKISGTIVS